MKTHRAWMIALVSVMAFATGPAWAQAPNPLANPGYATFSQGPPVIQQASYAACGACGGSGCGICGVAPSAGGFRLSNWAANHHGTKRSRACGCESGACGGGCPTPIAAPSCEACGTSCGGACGGLGGLGGMLGGGGIGGHLQAMNASRYGGYSTMMHGQQNGPFGGGGCCTPIWYDVHVEWMHLHRNQSSRPIDFTSRDVGGPIVLSTSDLDLGDGHGVRGTYSLLVGPSTALELTYFGGHSWDESATVTGTADLYSVFSNFGTFPAVPGFPQTVDEANVHTIGYSSELHNGEINVRRRWTSANCMLHGSYLMGARYVSLEEWFGYNTQADSGGSLDYDVDASNDLYGVQFGGEMFVCFSPRFKLGVELEGGIYGNDASVSTVVNTVDGIVTSTPVNEELTDEDVAFVGEIGAIGLFRVTPRLTIRGGYTLLYMDGVALASDNFNTAAPFASFSADRIPRIYNDADVLYHGANLGITWTW